MKRYAAVMLLCILVSGVSASAAMANSFYTEGEVRDLSGAKNFGRTIVDILLTLGLPLSSVALFVGGLFKFASREPGKGVAGVGSGVGAGYVSTLVNNLHGDAQASTSLASMSPESTWPWVVLNLVLQAALVATLLMALRRGSRCGKPAAASLMPQ